MKFKLRIMIVKMNNCDMKLSLKWRIIRFKINDSNIEKEELWNIKSRIARNKIKKY